MKMYPVVFYSDFFKESVPLHAMHFISKYPTDHVLFLLSKANASLISQEGEKLWATILVKISVVMDA
jgi:hypothetical protein